MAENTKTRTAAFARFSENNRIFAEDKTVNLQKNK